MLSPIILLANAGSSTGDVDPYTGWENLKLIASKPDNVPIIMMIVIFAFFTYLALRDAKKNDRLIKEGRKQDILKSMQE
ncbi:MAG: hypothetical protein ACT4TC_06965 [Myxococcaceae bacterium]